MLFIKSHHHCLYNIISHINLLISIDISNILYDIYDSYFIRLYRFHDIFKMFHNSDLLYSYNKLCKIMLFIKSHQFVCNIIDHVN